MSVKRKSSRYDTGRRMKRPFNMSGKALFRYPRQSQPVRLVKTFWAGNWTPNTSTTAGFWQYVSTNISALAEINSIRDLFESVKIESIKFTFRPRYTGYDGANTTDTTLPGVTNQGNNDVHVIIDPKSLIVPSGTYNATTLNTFLTNGSVKTYSGHRPFSFTVKYPTMRDDINGAANAKVVRSNWHDVQRTLQHYGAHVFISDVNLTGNFSQSYDMFHTITMSLKGQS